MKNGDFREAVIEWAAACLGGDEGKTRPAVDKRSSGHAIGEVAARFGLETIEVRLLELAYAVERSAKVARVARAKAAAGAAGLTVEVAREALGDGVDAALGPDRALRRHALVVAGEGGFVGGGDGIRIGPGLAARLDGEADPEGLAPGTRRIAAPVDGTVWVEKYPPTARGAEVIKETLVGDEARLVTIDGCGKREAIGIAVGLVRRLGRGVLALDGEAVARMAGAATVLAAARREADLDGLALVVYQSACLGEAWRAAAGRPAKGAKALALVVLADAEKPREVLLVDGLLHVHRVMYAGDGAPAAAGAAASAPAAQVAATPPKDDGYEHIRQMAMRDAERALGIIRPQDARPIPPPARPVAAPVQAPPPPVVAAPAPAVAPAPAPVSVAAPAVAPPAAAAPAPAPAAAAAAPAGAPPRRKRSKKAIEMFGPDPEDLPVAPSAAPAAPPPAAAVVPAAAAPALAMPPPSTAPYVPIADNASLDEIARVASTSPNPDQRVELITRLNGLKSASVVASLRANAQSQHPAVRAAAESVMAAMFGQNWNKTKAIPKPVQTPPSDDKDRGPPGGW